MITCAWSPDSNRNAQSNRDSVVSEGRRGAMAKLLGTPSMMVAISFAGATPSSAVASTSTLATNHLTTADDIRRIYDAGAQGYESVYTESIVSKALDFSALRTNLLEKASGDILEMGVGTGLNLPHYPSADTTKTATTATKPIITSYTGLDISTKMMELAQGRFARGFPQVSSSLEALYKDKRVRFEVGDVNNLEGIFGETGTTTAKFDTVIDTFSLCVFPDPSKALEQARKVLKPGGRLLLLEHQDSLISKTLSPTRSIADVSGTCRYDDDVLDLVKKAGFVVNSSKNLAGGFLVEVVATRK